MYDPSLRSGYALLGGILALAACCALFWCLDGLRYDDSFIFLRVAHNLSLGEGPVWNPGDRFTNSTSALWPGLLAIGSLVFGRENLPLLAKTLSFACLVGASFALFAVIRRSPRPATAWVAAFAVFLPSHQLLLCGMESPLALALLLAALAAYVYGASLGIVALALAGLYLARPDGLLFAGLLLADYLFLGWTPRGRDANGRKAGLGLRLRACRLPALLFVAVCASWHLYLYACTGSLLPATLHAKIVQGTSHTYWTPFSGELGSMLLNSAGHSRLMLGLAAVGLIIAWEVAPLLVLWVALHLIAYSLMGIAAYPWYYYPLYVLVDLCAFLTLARAAELGMSGTRAQVRSGPASLVLRAVVVLCAAALGIFAMDTQTGVPFGEFARWAANLRPRGESDLHLSAREAYADSRREAHEQVSHWLITERSGTRGATVLTDEIGVVGYRLADWRVVDEVGMTDPAFDKSRIHDWRHYVASDHPRFIIRNYLANQPDVISFPIAPDRYAVYEKVFEPSGAFIAPIYEHRLDYAPGSRFLEDAQPVTRTQADVPIGAPGLRFEGIEVYRLRWHVPAYAIVSRFSGPPASSADAGIVENYRGPEGPLVAPGMEWLIPTAEWRSGGELRRITIAALAPGRYRLSIGLAGAGPVSPPEGEFDVPRDGE